MKNKILLIFISGLLLRFFFMSFFYHPDLKSQFFHAQFLSAGIMNIYSYIPAHLASLPYRDTFNYPPLTYFILGTWETVARFLAGPGLPSWLNDWGSAAAFNPHISFFLFWLKIPYLAADLILLYLLLAVVPAAKRQLAAYLWAFNPVSLYAVYMIGQFDILPALLTFLAYIYSRKQKLFVAIFLLSIAVALKTYPVFLLPFIFIRSKNLKHLFLQILIFVSASFLWVFPFIKTSGFINAVFLSPLGQRLFIAGIDIGFGERLPLFFILYSFVLCWSWVGRTRFDLLPEYIFTSSAILALGHYHAQWAVWSLPFWLIFFVRNTKYLVLSLFASLLYFLDIFMLSDQYTLIGMFSPLNPNLSNVPPLTDYLKNIINPAVVQSLFHALLTGALAYLIYQVFRTADET